jgi:hypothetical protein
MEGRSSAAELDDWRTQCWTYLDSKGEGTKLENPETIALRAVLCVLYTETPMRNPWRTQRIGSSCCCFVSEKQPTKSSPN